MFRAQSPVFVFVGSVVIPLLTATNLMAGTAPQIVAGIIEGDEFRTLLGLQNVSGKDCPIGILYHKGAMKSPGKTILTDGEDMGNSFIKHIPSHGSTRIEVTTAPGTDTIFTGAASFFFEDSVCLNAVGITAEYRVKPVSEDTIKEVFSFKLSGSYPLDQCAAAGVKYDPPSDTPALAVVSNGGAKLPPGTMTSMKLYAHEGTLLNSTPPTEYDGSHWAQNLPEIFPRQGPFSGLWEICTTKPENSPNIFAIDALFISVVKEGDNVQFAATSGQRVNEDCLVDDNTMCLLNQRFLTTFSLQDSPDGPSRPGKVGSTDGSSGTFVDEQTGVKFAVSVLDGCSSDFPSYWVLGAADTTFGYTLTVTDTSSDAIKTYQNPLGQASEAIIDTSAFATCP